MRNCLSAVTFSRSNVYIQVYICLIRSQYSQTRVLSYYATEISRSSSEISKREGELWYEYVPGFRPRDVHDLTRGLAFRGLPTSTAWAREQPEQIPLWDILFRDTSVCIQYLLTFVLYYIGRSRVPGKPLHDLSDRYKAIGWWSAILDPSQITILLKLEIFKSILNVCLSSTHLIVRHIKPLVVNTYCCIYAWFVFK